MGYYYDWLEQKWAPIDHGRTLNRREQRRIDRRRALIDDLILEFKCGRDGQIALFAGLLLRALVRSDEQLMRDRGEAIANVSFDEVPEPRSWR